MTRPKQTQQPAKEKRPVTINTRLRGACIAEAKANLSGATRALREDDLATARQMMTQAGQSLDRAESYAERVASSDAEQEPNQDQSAQSAPVGSV